MPQGNTISNMTPATFQVQYTIAASAAAGTNVNAVFLEYSGATSKNFEQVPPDQVWSLTKLYALSSLSVNMIVNLYIGSTPQSINTDTSVMVITSSTLNPVNPFEDHMIIDSGQTFYFVGNLDTANSTTVAVVETLYLVMKQYPRAIAAAMNAKGLPL